ncbi:MAG: N-acetylmannosamine-6-phosphate 2-epimerase [Terriglobia bacterium]
MNSFDGIRKLKGGLIVSCQEPPASPLSRPEIIAALALTAEQQGALGTRINGPENIRGVRAATSVPVIGIEKARVRGSPVYITPAWKYVERVFKAGAQIIALDATDRRRPKGEALDALMRRTKALTVPVMADVATLDDGLRAVDLGADVIATTLCGYTRETRHCVGPAFRLLEDLVRRVRVPIVLEGRVRTPEDLRRAFDSGAYAVVVGTAITHVAWLTRNFAEATPRFRRRRCASESG